MQRINNSGDRYIRDGGTTYTGPGSSGYVSAGSVDAGELVAYTGYKYNDYALIEYSVGSTSNKKRAWYSAGDMTREPSPGLVVGQRPSDMNINSSHYTTSNMYYPDYVGECTWFCWGRAHEKCGKSIQFTGSNNGGEWYIQNGDGLPANNENEAANSCEIIAACVPGDYNLSLNTATTTVNKYLFAVLGCSICFLYAAAYPAGSILV